MKFGNLHHCLQSFLWGSNERKKKTFEMCTNYPSKYFHQKKKVIFLFEKFSWIRILQFLKVQLHVFPRNRFFNCDTILYKNYHYFSSIEEVMFEIFLYLLSLKKLFYIFLVRYLTVFTLILIPQVHREK